jgi:hypothetical protein
LAQGVDHLEAEIKSMNALKQDFLVLSIHRAQRKPEKSLTEPSGKRTFLRAPDNYL